MAASKRCVRATHHPLRSWPRSSDRNASAEPVFALDLVLAQAPDARLRTARIGDRDRDHDLVGTRRIGDPHLHPVEMTANIGGILVPERNVECRPGTGAFL